MPNCKDRVDINKLMKGLGCAFMVAAVNAAVNVAVVDRNMKSELSHMFVLVPAAVGMAAGALTTLSASFDNSCMPALVKDNTSSFSTMASALVAGAATFTFQQIQNIHFQDFFAAKLNSVICNATMILAALAYMPEVRASIAQCSTSCNALKNRIFTTANGDASSAGDATSGATATAGATLENPLLDDRDGNDDVEAGSAHSSISSLGGSGN